MKLICSCGFDTESFKNLEDVKADLKKRSGEYPSWYEDDFENRCPQCGTNQLRLIEEAN